jgi:hypothetical protein
MAELDHHTKRIQELMGALQEAIDYIDDESDTVDGPDGPEPNAAMSMATHLTHILEGGY